MHIHAQLDNGQTNSVLSCQSQVQFIMYIGCIPMMIVDHKT